MRKWLLVLVCLLGLVLYTWPVLGWFDLPWNYLQAAICYLNDTDVSPVLADGNVTASEGGTLSPNVTVRVQVIAEDAAIEQVYLQYKDVAGDWQDLSPIRWTTRGAAVVDDMDEYLVAYWPMGETSESVGNHTLTNSGASVVAAKRGDGYDLEYSDGDYLWCADHADLSPTTGVILSAWVKAESHPDLLGGYAVIAGKGNGVDDTELNYALLHQQQVFSSRWYFRAGESGVAYGPTNVVLGSWYHLVGVAYGTTISLYVNGVEYTGAGFDGSITDSGSQWKIGDAGWTFLSFDGVVDEVALWKNPTFASEGVRDAWVRALYSAGGVFYPWATGGSTYIAEIEFLHPQVSFGHDRFGTGHVPAGNSTLLRLYVSDGINETLDVTQDSDEDGELGNGTDGQVVSFTVHATNLKPGRGTRRAISKPPPDQP